MSYPEYQDYKTALGAPKMLEPTTKDILGPFHKDGAPFREDISEGLPDAFELHGSVRDTDDGSIYGAVLDFWQANPQGEYDEVGFKHRARTKANAGYAHSYQHNNYVLKTVRPGCYDISEPDAKQPHEFRCPHIHVIVTAPGFKRLVTQLYFPAGEHNETDHWFSSKRLLLVTRVPGKYVFDFVLERE